MHSAASHVHKTCSPRGTNGPKSCSEPGLRPPVCESRRMTKITNTQPSDGETRGQASARPSLSRHDGGHLFFNRELSQVEFYRRVLEEALDAEQPPLERLKFLAIFAEN